MQIVWRNGARKCATDSESPVSSIKLEKLNFFTSLCVVLRICKPFCKRMNFWIALRLCLLVGNIFQQNEFSIDQCYNHYLEISYPLMLTHQWFACSLIFIFHTTYKSVFFDILQIRFFSKPICQTHKAIRVNIVWDKIFPLIRKRGIVIIYIVISLSVFIWENTWDTKKKEELLYESEF